MADLPTTTSTILCTCARNIPPILRRELEDLGYVVKAEYPSGVEIEGTLQDCLRLNLWLRTAHRVLFRLGAWEANTADEMYEAVNSVEWDQWIPAKGYVSVIGSVDTKSIDNVMYANMRCKDAVVDRIRTVRGIRPDSGPDTSMSVVFLYWHDETLMIYVDTSGTPLSDRGYRISSGKAPMRESLAAAVVLSTKWAPHLPFVNPMTGSGTLGIEAALIGRKIPPGSMRDGFGFMHLLPVDPRVWQTMRKEAIAQVDTKIDLKILCSDNDIRVIRQARENAKRAGVTASFTVADFREVSPPSIGNVASGDSDNEHTPVVIMNPEFGIRIGDERTLRTTYREIGDLYKQKFRGYTGYVFTGNFSLAKEIGLRSKRRLTFWSADLECRLLEFELYEGSRIQYPERSSDEVT